MYDEEAESHEKCQDQDIVTYYFFYEEGKTMPYRGVTG